ncbi:MAG: hypothetical protein KJI71_02215 [Patescibacteria group bacterium]|nr:hypothetical protein [Patescibacteria group bacterium]
MSKTKAYPLFEEILDDIKPIKEIWSNVIDKYNTRFHSLEFLTDKERSEVAGDVFRRLDRYAEILKNYYYKELHGKEEKSIE